MPLRKFAEPASGSSIPPLKFKAVMPALKALVSSKPPEFRLIVELLVPVVVVVNVPWTSTEALLMFSVPTDVPPDTLEEAM